MEEAPKHSGNNFILIQMTWKSKQASARTNEQTLNAMSNLLCNELDVSTHSWSNNCQNHFRCSRVLAYNSNHFNRKIFTWMRKNARKNERERTLERRRLWRHTHSYTLHKSPCNRIDFLNDESNLFCFVLSFFFAFILVYSSPVSHVNSKSKRFPVYSYHINVF